jgi:hypothetical protein
MLTRFRLRMNFESSSMSCRLSGVEGAWASFWAFCGGVFAEVPYPRSFAPLTFE